MSGTTLFLGGIFNVVDPFIFIQVYIWIWVLITFIAICMWVLFRYGVWEKYKVLWGLYYAFKAESNAAFIFNLALKAELYSEAQAKCIFDYSSYKYEGFSTAWWGLQGWVERRIFNYATVYLDNLDPLVAVVYKFGKRNMDVEIAKKMEGGKRWQDTSSVNIGGSDTDIILDANRRTVKGSLQNKATIAYCEIWNEANPKDQIHSHVKFQEYLMNGRINKAATTMLDPIETEVLVSWTRIDETFPIDIEDNEQGGARRQQADDEMNAEANQFNKYIPHVLIGGTLFAFVIVGLRFVAFLVTKH
jgi:hypothetical protein